MDLALEALLEVVPHPNRIGNGGEGGIHRSDARKEAGIHDIEIVEVVGLAIDIQYRRSRIITKTASAGLMSHGGYRHGTLNINLAFNQMVFEIKLIKH